MMSSDIELSTFSRGSNQRKPSLPGTFKVEQRNTGRSGAGHDNRAFTRDLASDDIPEEVDSSNGGDEVDNGHGDQDGAAGVVSSETGASGGDNADNHEESPVTQTSLNSRQRRRWDVFYASPGDDVTSYSESKSGYRARVVLKISFILISFLLVLSSATFARVSLMVITFYLRPKNSNWTDNDFFPKHITSPRRTPGGITLAETDVKWIWAAIFIIVAPYVFTFISTLWKVVFKITGKLTTTGLLLAFVQESLHSFGLCTLVFYILPRHHPLLGSMYLASTAAVPSTLVALIPKLSLASPASTHDEDDNTTQKKCALWRYWSVRTLDVIAFLIQAAIICLWTYAEFAQGQSVAMVILLPLSLICISVENWENYVTSWTQATDKVPGVMAKLTKLLRRGKTKTRLIMSLWKVVFTIGSCFARSTTQTTTYDIALFYNQI